MNTDKEIYERKHIRFQADINTIIWISKDTSQFKKEFLGLVDGESHGGSSFTINQDLKLNEGDFILVQVGKMHTIMAEVRWIKKFNDNLFRFGLMYLG